METRATIITSMLRLLADRPFEEVTLRAIARDAGLTLSELAAAFTTRGAILAAYTRQVDEAVLAAEFDDMADQPPRERLFDVLMTRLETLRPHRDAVASLLESARRDTQLALFLNALQLTSMRWMMEAASITPTGWQGRAALQALSISFAKVLRVFVKEDDAGLPRTMAALDKELRAAEARHKRLARVFGSGVHAEPARSSAPPAGPAADASSEGSAPGGGAAPARDAAAEPVDADAPGAPQAGTDTPGTPNGGANAASSAQDGGSAGAPTPPPVEPPAANDDDGNDTPKPETPKP